MARETVEIGGREFTVTTFDAFTGLKIAGDLQKQFLAPLLSVIDGKEAGSPENVTAAFMKGVERVAREMDGDKLVATAKRLLLAENILVDMDGRRMPLDNGTWPQVLTDVADLLELCLAVVRLNFAPLATRAASLIGAARLPNLTGALKA